MTLIRLSAFVLMMVAASASAIAGGDGRNARLVYPNPFTEDCTFTLTMPAPGNVRIIVFDLLGRQVANLTDRLGKDYYETGSHPIYWNGRDESGDPVPAGTYVCVLWSSSGEVINSVKVVKVAGIN